MSRRPVLRDLQRVAVACPGRVRGLWMCFAGTVYVAYAPRSPRWRLGLVGRRWRRSPRGATATVTAGRHGSVDASVGRMRMCFAGTVYVAYAPRSPRWRFGLVGRRWRRSPRFGGCIRGQDADVLCRDRVRRLRSAFPALALGARWAALTPVATGGDRYGYCRSPRGATATGAYDLCDALPSAGRDCPGATA